MPTTTINPNLEKLNDEFKLTISEEIKVKEQKTEKAIKSLKEIIDQKNTDLNNIDNKLEHYKRKIEELQIN